MKIVADQRRPDFRAGEVEGVSGGWFNREPDVGVVRDGSGKVDLCASGIDPEREGIIDPTTGASRDYRARRN